MHDGRGTITRAGEIAEVFRGFSDGRQSDIETVRRWIGSVVCRGNWRFRDPEAVVQEILLQLVKLARSGRVHEPRAFQKFVYTVSKSHCVNTYHRERSRGRRESPESEIGEPAGASNPGQDLEQRERFEMMLYIYQRLPEGCRELWRFVYGDGLSTGAVSKQLGISTTNVRVRVHRCLEKAKQIYGQLDSWPVPGSRGS